MTRPNHKTSVAYPEGLVFCNLVCKFILGPKSALKMSPDIVRGQQRVPWWLEKSF